LPKPSRINSRWKGRWLIAYEDDVSRSFLKKDYSDYNYQDVANVVLKKGIKRAAEGKHVGQTLSSVDTKTRMG